MSTASGASSSVLSKSRIIFPPAFPTLVPDTTVAHPLVDIIITGEADITFTDIVHALDKGKDLRDVASMNAFFIIPTNVKARAAELFMDHPPLEKRLARLSEIAREMGRPVD